MFHRNSSSAIQIINLIFQYLNDNVASIWHQLLWCYAFQTTKVGGIDTSGQVFFIPPY